MKKKIGLILLAITALFLGYVAIQPSDYVISREISINAPVEKVFPYLNSAKLGALWGPWLEMDPAAKMDYSGPEFGVGSRTSWTEGKQLGTGSATIAESTPNERVGIKLEYSKPQVMNQFAEYLVKSSGNETRVTWRVTGKNTFPGRLVCLFLDMDKMVGGMFEKGLAKLKTVVESQKS